MSICARRIVDVQEKNKTEKRADRKGLFIFNDAVMLSGRELLLHLCDEGPESCGDCGLCAYGREHIRRARAMKGMIRDELMKKYGANVHDMNAILKGIAPIGKTQDRHPARIYEEETAGKALAHLWRLRAAMYRRNAEKWEERAEQAEKMATEAKENDRRTDDTGHEAGHGVPDGSIPVCQRRGGAAGDSGAGEAEAGAELYSAGV